MNIDVVIVDDEKKSREGLKNLLEEFCPGVNVAGMASSASEGIEQIRAHKPGLVLLDIEMQTSTGFNMLEDLGEIDFEVIFTTAYEQYALKAIKFSALDYLLKPIDVQELRVAIDKVADRKRKQESNEQIKLLLKNLKIENPRNHKITLSTSEGMVFIPVENIIRCEAQGAYTTFFIQDGKKILVSKNLKEYESLLVDYGFYRVHNSHLINLVKVEKYVKSDGGYVVMKDGAQVAISNTRKDEFLDLMKNL